MEEREEEGWREETWGEGKEVEGGERRGEGEERRMIVISKNLQSTRS